MDERKSRRGLARHRETCSLGDPSNRLAGGKRVAGSPLVWAASKRCPHIRVGSSCHRPDTFHNVLTLPPVYGVVSSTIRGINKLRINKPANEAH